MSKPSRSRQRIWIDPRWDTPEFRAFVRQREPEAEIMGCGFKSKPRTVLVLTHGESGDRYSTLAGKAVSHKAALTVQQDLFVTPAEDGLFPGHSQTWRKEG